MVGYPTNIRILKIRNCVFVRFPHCVLIKIFKAPGRLRRISFRFFVLEEVASIALEVGEQGIIYFICGQLTGATSRDDLFSLFFADAILGDVKESEILIVVRL